MEHLARPCKPSSRFVQKNLEVERRGTACPIQRQQIPQDCDVRNRPRSQGLLEPFLGLAKYRTVRAQSRLQSGRPFHATSQQAARILAQPPHTNNLPLPPKP